MQKKDSNIKKNFTYQMIYEVLIFVLPFITSPYIARVIGAEGLGIYSFSYSVAYYFVLVSMLGLKNYGNREIAKVRDNPLELSKTFSDITTLHVIVSLICIFTYIVYSLCKKEDSLYAWIQIFFVTSALFDISWFYFGIEKFKLTVTRNTIIKIMNIIFVFLFVRSKEDLWIYCLIMALGSLISQLCLWIPLHRYVKISKPDVERVLSHLKPLIILFIPAIAVSLYKYMDKIMIGSLSSKAQLGYYENAEKVINIPLTIIVSFGIVMLPRMSNLAASGKQSETQRYIKLSMQFVMCLSFALAFGLAGIGNVFAPIFWGNEFEASGNIIMGLAITIPFISFADVIRTQFLIPRERDREYLISVVSGAIINLIINYILIPHYGAIGAMIGTIAAEVTVCIIQAVSVNKELPVIIYVKKSIVFALAGSVMFFGVYYIGVVSGKHIWTLFVQILAGMIFYGLFAIIYFTKSDNEIVSKMIYDMKNKMQKGPWHL